MLPSNWGITWSWLVGGLLLQLDSTMLRLLWLEAKVDFNRELRVTCKSEDVWFGEFIN